MQELAWLEDRARQKRNQWHDIRSGKIRFATEAEKLVHLEGTWIRWKQAVADLNAHKKDGSRVSSSPKQGEVMRITIQGLTPQRSVAHLDGTPNDEVPSEMPGLR